MAVFLTPDVILEKNGVKIKQYLLTKHNPNGISIPAKRIDAYVGPTLHNTDRINAAAGTTCAEQYTRATVNGNMKTVRPTFYVDDVEAWQLLPCDYQSWCSGHSPYPSANGSDKGNSCSINVECIMDGSGSAADLKARDNAARLIAWLLDTYGGELYTHNYWENIRIGRKGTIDELNRLNDGYKGCPIFIRPKWDDFKQLVQKYRKSEEQKKTMYYVQIGAFRELKNAQIQLKLAQEKYPSAFIKMTDGLYRVQLGAFGVKKNAEKFLADVKKDYPNAFIKEI